MHRSWDQLPASGRCGSLAAGQAVTAGKIGGDNDPLAAAVDCGRSVPFETSVNISKADCTFTAGVGNPVQAGPVLGSCTLVLTKFN